jgi:hypothetical protein
MSKILPMMGFLVALFCGSQSYANSNVVVLNNTGQQIKVGGHVIDHKEMHVSSYTANIELLDGRTVHLHDTGKKCKDGKWKFSVNGADIFSDPAQCTHLGWGAIGCQAAVVQLVDGYKVRIDMSDSNKCTGEWIKENEGIIEDVMQAITAIMLVTLAPEFVELDAEEMQVALQAAFKKQAKKLVKKIAKDELETLIESEIFSAKSMAYYAGVQAKKAIEANDKEIADRILRKIQFVSACVIAGAKWHSDKPFEKNGNACST